MDKLICVYGTLKYGGHNHHYLKNAKYVGKFITPACYTMYNYGFYPAITLQGETPIHCEVYKITDKESIKAIYRLEGFTGERNSSKNYYDTADIETPFGKAEIFYVKEPRTNTKIKTGIWPLNT